MSQTAGGELNIGVTGRIAPFNIPFTETYVSQWILQFHSYLTMNGVSEDNTMARLLFIQALPTRFLAHIDTTLNFKDMEKLLLRICGISPDKALTDLLAPSQRSYDSLRNTFHHITQGANLALPAADKETLEKIVRAKFLAQIPQDIRQFLLVAGECSLDKLVDLAESLQDKSDPDVQVMNISSVAALDDKITRLEETVRKLTVQRQHSEGHNYTVRSESPNPRQLRSQNDNSNKSYLSRSPSPHPRPKIRQQESYSSNQSVRDYDTCYYHKRFGDQARKCTCSQSSVRFRDMHPKDHGL